MNHKLFNYMQNPGAERAEPRKGAFIDLAYQRPTIRAYSMSMTPQAAAQSLAELFREHADPENAVQMKAYMRGQFDFFGIQAKPLRALARNFVKQHQDLAVVEALWQLPQRELQFIAVDILRKIAPRLPADSIHTIEHLITDKSWWDTVDHLAINVVGPLCKAHPELIKQTIAPWGYHANFWLRRTAILFQLKYKIDLDTNLLTQMILANADDEEFFIRKAIGWILRQHAKTDAAFVQQFIMDHALSPLSVREATKHL